MDKPVLEINHVGFRFTDGRQALADVTLTVDSRASVGFVGPNGAGKTTLLLNIMGVRVPTEGSIHIQGRPGPGENPRARALQVGMVFEDTDDQLFCATVFDDVAFGPLNLGLAPDQVRQRVRESLARVGMADAEQRIPHHLSAGEKRRVALATVLAMQPEILLLDEPTNDLDPRGRRQLIELINSLEQTKLITSHDLEFVLATCPRVVILDGGQVMADGPARELLADAQRMEQHGLEVPYSLNGRA